MTSTVPNPSPGFKLVTHGSLLERYGIQILLESVAILRERIPGVQLDVIGSGEYEAELKRLAHELLIDDVVRFVGPVPFQCMASRLLRADVGVGPYLLDLLPNKVMEYFLLGIPVVASDWPTLRRYFGDESVKYVRPADAQALADGIHDLYRHPRIRRRRAKIAQERYLASLTWNKTKHDYLAVYGVAEAPSAPAPGPVAARSRQTWVKFVLRQSRGPRNAMTRLPTIVNRFGITPRKSIRHFEAFLTVTDRHGVVPTLPVTAVAARRNPAVLRWLRDRGVELAAHGYVHNDYASLSAHDQRKQVAIARNELDALGFTVRGWRCPYSRWNNDTMAALRAGGFEYDATPVYEWPALAQERIVMAPDARGDYARLCALFNVRDAGTRAVLPVADEGLVRIPMSIPQDEDMVDRLHLGPEEMSRVWLRVLHESRRFGEVFVICLHPERAAICAAPLDATLTEARSRGDIWIAPLGDIAAWWKERAHAAVSVERDGHDGQWRVRADGSGRTVVAFGQRKIQGSAVVEIEAAHKPVVYAGPEWPDASCRRIAEAGYVITRDQADAGACSIDLTRDFSTAANSEEVVRRLHGRSDELIRLQPWPAGFRSCLSVTGDIDALTLFDFAMRFKEFS